MDFFRNFLVTAFLLVPAAAGYADDRPVLRISTIVMPPYVAQHADGNVRGIAVDAVDAIAARCNIRTRVIVMPSWRRAYQSAQIGVTDAVIPTNYSPERASYFDFPATPLLTLSPRLFVRRDSGLERFTGVSMLAGHGVAVRENAILEQEFDAYVRSGAVRLIQRGETQALIEDLLSGRVQFVASPPIMLQAKIDTLGFTMHIRQLDPPLGISVQYLALSKKRGAAVAAETEASQCLLGEAS